jgi:hypothetical protein
MIGKGRQVEHFAAHINDGNGDSERDGETLELAEAANDDVAVAALADDLDGVAVVVVMIRRTFPLPLLLLLLLFNSSGAVPGNLQDRS